MGLLSDEMAERALRMMTEPDREVLAELLQRPDMFKTFKPSGVVYPMFQHGVDITDERQVHGAAWRALEDAFATAMQDLTSGTEAPGLSRDQWAALLRLCQGHTSLLDLAWLNPAADPLFIVDFDTDQGQGRGYRDLGRRLSLYLAFNPMGQFSQAVDGNVGFDDKDRKYIEYILTNMAATYPDDLLSVHGHSMRWWRAVNDYAQGLENEDLADLMRSMARDPAGISDQVRWWRKPIIYSADAADPFAARWVSLALNQRWTIAEFFRRWNHWWSFWAEATSQSLPVGGVKE